MYSKLVSYYLKWSLLKSNMTLHFIIHLSNYNSVENIKIEKGFLNYSYPRIDPWVLMQIGKGG